MDCLNNTDFVTRKMALDVLQTIASSIPNALKPYKADIIEILNELKFDKMKPVRDATNETLTAMKDVPESGIEQIKVKVDPQADARQKTAKIIEKMKKEERKPRFVQNKEVTDEYDAADNEVVVEQPTQKEKKVSLAT